MLPVVLALSAFWVGILAVIVVVLGRRSIQRTIRRRMDEFDVEVIAGVADERGGWLGRWLYISGFRSTSAPTVFVLTTLGFTLAGSAVAVAINASGAVQLVDGLLRDVPGGVGEVFLPFAWAGPWMAVFIIGLGPTLVVRARRRRRVMQVEQDLPMTLDLLATLAQAGLGFDAALDRIVAAGRADRPLAQEFRTFQYDLIAGRPRVEALRRLSRRVEVPWFTIFVSAVVQAEQIGAGLAGVLQTQADDLRQRRRERALAFAMAIPVKMVFPLIVCFLPGIFVAALGPMVFQIIQTLDAFVRPLTGGG